MFRKRNQRDPLKQSIFTSFFRQVWTEGRLLLFRGLSFRSRDNEAAREAYRKMHLNDFEGINARQRWANWRTIPRNLRGRLSHAPVYALDLCCGTGHSTEVLAHHLPEGSKILGIEYNPEFIEAAKKRTYRHFSGKLLQVSFRVQSVLEPFLDERGQRIADSAVDLVNSCGAVGSHFDPQMTRVLAQEVSRVLKPGGLALIDSGLPGTHRGQLTEIFEALGFEVLGSAKSSILDLFTQVCFRKK